MISGQTLTARG